MVQNLSELSEKIQGRKAQQQATINPKTESNASSLTIILPAEEFVNRFYRKIELFFYFCGYM